jgi:hypothetical protein
MRDRKTRGIRPDRPPDFAPKGGVSLEQAGRFNELRDRARKNKISLAHFVSLIVKTRCNVPTLDVESQLNKLEQLVDEEIEREGGPR